MSLTRFEKNLCLELASQTGRKIPPRLLAWSISKDWILKIKAEDENIIFLPAFEVWCLVLNRRQKFKKVQHVECER